MLWSMLSVVIAANIGATALHTYPRKDAVDDRAVCLAP